MLSKEGLHNLLQLKVTSTAPEVLVYCAEHSIRLKYVCDFVFNHALNVKYKLTCDKDAFEKSNQPKLNYSNSSFESTSQIVPAGLLAEKGISELKPNPVFRNEMIYFYPTKEMSEDCFHFDLFSAVFYFISRYEEWQAFTPDKHGRFEAAHSLLFQNNFHLKPVVEIWISELTQLIQKKHFDFSFPKREFTVISTIDVDNLFAYREKGFVRTLGATAKDVLKRDFVNLKERVAVLLGKKKDPFDIYDSVSDFCFENKIPLLYFFLFRTGTPFDRTVDPNAPVFKQVFKTVDENHATIGIHPSYDASVKPEVFKRELKNISAKSNKKIVFSRQHFLRFNIRSTPHLLMNDGIEADFSMGFASEPGFRAGTSLPFYYYDFNSESVSSLLFVPFCVMDGVYTVYKIISAQQSLDPMLSLAFDLKKVKGNFVSVFHERTFSDHLYPGFGTLYKNLHLRLKEL